MKNGNRTGQCIWVIQEELNSQLVHNSGTSSVEVNTVSNAMNNELVSQDSDKVVKSVNDL